MGQPNSMWQHNSRTQVRARLIAGCAAAMTGVLVCSAAPPPAVQDGRSFEARAVRLASLVAPVPYRPTVAVEAPVSDDGGADVDDLDPALLYDAPASAGAPTRLAPDIQSVIPAPSGDLGPGLHIFFGLAQFVIQPLAWIGDLLPADLQQYYYVFVYLPISLPLAFLSYFADAAINSLLGVAGYGTSAVAAAASVDTLAATDAETSDTPPAVGAAAPAARESTRPEQHAAATAVSARESEDDAPATGATATAEPTGAPVEPESSPPPTETADAEPAPPAPDVAATEQTAAAGDDTEVDAAGTSSVDSDAEVPAEKSPETVDAEEESPAAGEKDHADPGSGIGDASSDGEHADTADNGGDTRSADPGTATGGDSSSANRGAPSDSAKSGESNDAE